MSKIIASALLNLPDQSYIEQQFAQKRIIARLGPLHGLGAAPSNDTSDLKKHNSRQIQVVLTSVKSIFSAVTPWLFERGHAIHGADELFILSSFCDTFQFSNTLTINNVYFAPRTVAQPQPVAQLAHHRSDDGGDQNTEDDFDFGLVPNILIPNSISKCAKFLKKLFILYCDSNCFSRELKTQLENANACFPFLEFINLENGRNPRHFGGGLSDSSLFERTTEVDIEMYSRFIRSDALATTENGRRLKFVSASRLAEIFYTSNTLGAGTNSSYRQTYLKSASTVVSASSPSTDDNKFKDIVAVVRHAMEHQQKSKRDNPLLLAYCNLLACLYMPRGEQEVEIELGYEMHFEWLMSKMAEILQDLRDEFALFIEKRWPIALRELDRILKTGPESVPPDDLEVYRSIESEREKYQSYFETFSKSLAFLSIAAPPSISHSIVVEWQQELFEPIPQLIELLLRYDFIEEEEEEGNENDDSDQEDANKNNDKLRQEHASNLTFRSDTVAGNMLGLTHAFNFKNQDTMMMMAMMNQGSSSSDEDDENNNKRIEPHIRICFSLIPFSTIVKCLHPARAPKLIDLSLRYIDEIVDEGLQTSHEIFSAAAGGQENEELLKQYIYMLKSHRRYSPPAISMVENRLNAPLKRDLDFPDAAVEPHQYLCQLTKVGFFETAFEMLESVAKRYKNKTSGSWSRSLDDSVTLFAPIIDICICFESFEIEVRNAKETFETTSEQWRAAHFSKYIDASAVRSRAAKNPGIAALYIRENITSAVETCFELHSIARLNSMRIPGASSTVAAMLTTCIEAISPPATTDEEREEIRRKLRHPISFDSKNIIKKRNDNNNKFAVELNARPNPWVVPTAKTSDKNNKNDDDDDEQQKPSKNPWAMPPTMQLANNHSSNSNKNMKNDDKEEKSTNSWSAGGWSSSSSASTKKEVVNQKEEDDEKKSTFSGWNSSWPSKSKFSSGSWNTSWPK